MKAKKNINVSTVVDFSNDYLKNKLFSKEQKEGVTILLEKVLHDTNNYNGFMFLNPNDCEINTLGHVSRKYFYNFK